MTPWQPWHHRTAAFVSSALIIPSPVNLHHKMVCPPWGGLWRVVFNLFALKGVSEMFFFLEVLGGPAGSLRVSFMPFSLSVSRRSKGCSHLIHRNLWMFRGRLWDAFDLSSCSKGVYWLHSKASAQDSVLNSFFIACCFCLSPDAPV